MSCPGVAIGIKIKYVLRSWWTSNIRSCTTTRDSIETLFLVAGSYALVGVDFLRNKRVQDETLPSVEMAKVSH